MYSDTSEKAFEQNIQRALTGYIDEDALHDITSPHYRDNKQHGKGYISGNSKDFDRRYAIDQRLFWQFLETTQPEELAKLKNLPNWKQQLLERLNNKIRKSGVVTVLKKGLEFNDAHLQLLYKGVYNNLNPNQHIEFGLNVFSVTRQVYYSETEPDKSVDMVLFINGLALATFELKKPQRSQNVLNAMKQYRETRDPKTTLFRFGQCLVHFAVDTDEVFMSTQINGDKTYFLPFNKGVDHGKGNPINIDGYKTAYLWNEILEPHSLVQIIEHFAKMVEEKDKKTGKTKKTLFFPRYHQMGVVRQLLHDAKHNGTGQRYLIQHSAGSGKSNSITWLAFQLIELYDPSGRENVFDSVIVVTDRRILDQQLRSNIRQFSEVKNLVAAAEKSSQLQSHLEQGKKLIITTIQKFPEIVKDITDMSHKRFAVIIDEAHSSQSGKSADKLNMSLGMEKSEDDLTEDVMQDKINRTLEGRMMSSNASYFAFTATPKKETLEKFGRKGEPDNEGKTPFYPHHLYSMKQAIEEKFILDVLQNYTTYQSFYEIQKSIADNPQYNNKKAQAKLKSYVESQPETIEKKAAVIVNHFIDNVVKTRKMKGKAKAMVVTSTIERAYDYFLVIQRLLAEARMPFGVIVAFSKKDGFDHTEASANNFPSKDIPEKFKSDAYRILIVANKFTTGFDEPLLHSMYVDKRLQGVQAVQTLSRLNRCNPKMEKNDTFVLDFYNKTEDIKEAFDPFYTSTMLSEATDVNALYDWKDTLDDVGVYEWSEVEQFNELFWNEKPDDELHPVADIAARRFDQLGEDLDDVDEADKLKIDFKIKAKQFVKVYSQIASIMDFKNVNWEMLHWYLLFLIPKLKVKTPEQEDLRKLLQSVDMSTYGMARVKLNDRIELDSDESALAPQNPEQRGYHGDEDKDPLDEIIANFNKRHFSSWEGTPEELKVKLIGTARIVYENEDYQSQVKNNNDEQNSRIALQGLIQKAVKIQRSRDSDLYKRYIQDDDFSRNYDDLIAQLLTYDFSDKNPPPDDDPNPELDT